MMIDFEQYFEGLYQFALKEIRYTLVDKEPNETEINVKVFDEIKVDKEDRMFDVVFCRNVEFEPEALYQLMVVYNVKLKLKDGIDADSLNIDWDNELTGNENPYVQNVASRASNLIANITSSYGHAPLITPPNLII